MHLDVGQLFHQVSLFRFSLGFFGFQRSDLGLNLSFFDLFLGFSCGFKLQRKSSFGCIKSRKLGLDISKFVLLIVQFRLNDRKLASVAVCNRFGGLGLGSLYKGSKNATANFVGSTNGTINGGAIVLALGVHAFGKGCQKKVHNTVSTSVTHGKMEGKHVLVIRASDCLGVELNEASNDIIRGIDNNSQVKRKLGPTHGSGDGIKSSHPSANLIMRRNGVGKETAGPVSGFQELGNCRPVLILNVLVERGAVTFIVTFESLIFHGFAVLELVVQGRVFGALALSGILRLGGGVGKSKVFPHGANGYGGITKRMGSLVLVSKGVVF
mmetsp:Transcript_8161/g.17033  ORF Transcript_8161/g.17033 Transcript_8161/m.17033 type:complete len:325 (-) Transcript_8161:68-1042(-)